MNIQSRSFWTILQPKVYVPYRIAAQKLVSRPNFYDNHGILRNHTRVLMIPVFPLVLPESIWWTLFRLYQCFLTMFLYPTQFCVWRKDPLGKVQTNMPMTDNTIFTTTKTHTLPLLSLPLCHYYLLPLRAPRMLLSTYQVLVNEFKIIRVTIRTKQ